MIYHSFDSKKKIIATLCRNRQTFRIVKKRSWEKIYYAHAAKVDTNGNPTGHFNRENIASIQFGTDIEKKETTKPTVDLSKSRMITFFGMVRRKINDYIRDELDYFVAPIELKKALCPRFNTKSFDSLKDGEVFWCIDINNAYWQMLYRHGAISDNIYNTYRIYRGYGKAKQIAIGLINAAASCVYYKKGEPLSDPDTGEIWRISEDNTPCKTLFRNIRHMTYNIVYDMLEIVEFERYIMRTQDSICVSQADVEVIENLLHNMKIEFKEIYCKKINSQEFQFDTEIRTIGGWKKNKSHDKKRNKL